MRPAIIVFTLLPVALSLSAQERFPKPEPEKAFPTLKVYDPAGSPLRVPKEDWAGAAGRVRDDPEWAKWLAARRAETDEWVATQRDRVEWVAGYWHNFVSEKDGSFLEWTPEPPKGVSEKVFGGWIFGFRSRNGEKVYEAARLYRLTGEKKYLDWAAGQLDFYAGNYEKWPIQTALSKSRLMCQSLDDANMLIRFMRAARLLRPDVSAERRREWHEKLFRPMALMLDETFQRVHNIACWQRSAMAMVALEAGDEELWAKAVDGPFGLRRQMRDGVTSEWLWVEQSLLYNDYVVSALLPFFEAAAIAGRLDSLKREAAIAENLMLGPAVLRFPDGKLPTPADSTGGFRRYPSRGSLAGARRLFPTWPGIEVAVGQRSWDTLLDPPEAPRAWSLPEVTSKNLESSRMAVIRKGGWQVYFHYGQLDSSHAQAEALQYEAYFEATDVTHDAGTVGYGSPLHRGFYTLGPAHNVPLIDGQGQARWAPGELVTFDGEAGIVEARQPEYRPGVMASRRLRIEGAKLVDTVRVETKDGQPHRLGLALHVQGKVELPAGYEADAGFALPYWSEARTAQAGRAVEFPFTAGGRRFVLKVEGPGPMKITHAVTPDAPPGKRDGLYFEVSGSEAEWRVSWEPAAAAQRERIELNRLGVAEPGLEVANQNFGAITNTVNDGRTFRGQIQFGW